MISSASPQASRASIAHDAINATTQLPAVQFAVNPMTSYQSAQVLGASPIQLMLIVYDLAIAACGRRDTERARRAITELIAALNFDYQEIAVPLFRLYEYCLSAVNSGKCHEAAKILRQLKGAWEAAMQHTPMPDRDVQGTRGGNNGYY